MSTEHDNLAPEPSDEALLAAEYVLGVLDAPARRAFAARMAKDAALAREVAQWQRRLSPMADEFEDVMPPLGHFTAITRTYELCRTVCVPAVTPACAGSENVRDGPEWRTVNAPSVNVARQLPLSSLTMVRAGLLARENW